jgi:integrase
MKNKYFIGRDYETIQEKNDILANYDKLHRDKITFLNDMYDNLSTLKGLWSVYNTHIHKHELLLGKDVMFFDNIEIDEIIASGFKYASSTKTNILHFIDMYKRWGVGRGDIPNNSMKAIDKRSAVVDMSKVLINKVWGLGEFYNLLIDIEIKASISDLMPLLLARYGMTGKQLVDMRGLRWADIDYEKKRVKIINEDGKLIRTLDVDDRFLHWIDKYRDSLDADVVTDYGYVLKKNNKARNDSLMENYNTINTRIYRACDNTKIPRIATGDLLKSRYIDLLLDIRKDRKLTTDDFAWVIMNFKEEATPSSIVTLKDYYEALTKDKVIGKNKGGKVESPLKDPNSKQTVEEIRERIGYKEFINKEENFENKEIQEINGLMVNSDGVILEEVSATTNSTTTDNN